MMLNKFKREVVQLSLPKDKVSTFEKKFPRFCNRQGVHCQVNVMFAGNLIRKGKVHVLVSGDPSKVKTCMDVIELM